MPRCCALSNVSTGAQGTRLYSTDGTVYLEILDDGTLSLFDTASGGTIYRFIGPTSNPKPYILVMQAVRAPLCLLCSALPLPRHHCSPPVSGKALPDRAGFVVHRLPKPVADRAHARFAG